VTFENGSQVIANFWLIYKTPEGVWKVAKDPKNTAPEKWSAKVTRESAALDLEEGVFTWKNPKRIARSLKESAEASTRRKATPFRSAMSMLVFYINRAGSNLDAKQKQVLEQAKEELRKLYGKA
jgi:putative cell wall-binding protein